MTAHEFPWRVGRDIWQSLYQFADQGDAERMCAHLNGFGANGFKAMHIEQILAEQAKARSA